MIKLIPGYDGAYGCDENGNIYSYYIRGSHDAKISTTPQLLIPYQGSGKYYCVGLSRNGEVKQCLVHRLIALTWIENPNNYPVVNHKDHNILNNNKDNLEWCTQRTNLSYSIKDFGALNGLRTRSRLFDPQNNLIGEFESLSAACDFCNEHFGISKSSLKKYKKSHGYYIEMDDNPNIDKFKIQLKKEWVLYAPDGNELGNFDSIIEAGKYIKENIRDISIKLFVTHKKAYGYYVKEKCRD